MCGYGELGCSSEHCCTIPQPYSRHCHTGDVDDPTPLWEDPAINSLHAEEPHAHFLPMETLELALANVQTAAPAQAPTGHTSSRYLVLDGLWKFAWSPTPAARPVDFWREGFNDSAWDELRVPGNWEMQGFGTPVRARPGARTRPSRNARPLDRHTCLDGGCRSTRPRMPYRRTARPWRPLCPCRSTRI